MRAVFIYYRENCGSILGLFISGAQAEHIVCIYRANGTVTLQKVEVISPSRWRSQQPETMSGKHPVYNYT